MFFRKNSSSDGSFRVHSWRYAENPELNLTALKHYPDALEMRALAHKMGAVLAGKLPHTPALVPGGITEKITLDKITAYKAMLNKLQTFISESYLPDVVEVTMVFPEYLHEGKGCSNFLCQGVFPEPGQEGSKLFESGVLRKGILDTFDPAKISEETRYAFYSSPSGLHPTAGQTVAAHPKDGAYSRIKAPRYGKEVMEVGPLARIALAYLRGRNPEVKNLVDQTLANLSITGEDLVSVMGRHLAGAIECKIIADRCARWIEQLLPGEPAFQDFAVAETGRGAGLTEAARGSLGHWLEIRDGKIARYKCVVPTTWNCSSRDDQGTPGPIEQAIDGTPIADADHPIEAVRVVRSFDPCIACAVH